MLGNELYHLAHEIFRGVSHYVVFCTSYFVLEVLFLGANSAFRGIIPLNFVKGKGNARISLYKLFKPVEIEDLIY